jgi:hypothetical protein
LNKETIDNLIEEHKVAIRVLQLAEELTFFVRKKDWKKTSIPSGMLLLTI